MKKILHHIELNLGTRAKEHRLRSLKTFDAGCDFFSNDYLGLRTMPPPVSPNLPNGAGGSRLISGNHQEYIDTEGYLANLWDVESALVFPSGYMTNLGLLSSLPQRNDVILFDELCHASIRDGIRLSHARSFKFKHNSLSDLKSLLLKHQGAEHLYVVTESVFSMDGDLAPLLEIAELCNAENTGLIVDEAHAIGTTKSGRGYVFELNLQQKVLATVVTFSKAIGQHGGAVLSTKLLREFLINHARSFIYTTGLPPENLLKIKWAFEWLIHQGSTSVDQLNSRITYFKDQLNSAARLSLLPSSTPIQAIVIGNSLQARNLENALQEKGFLVKAILHPTVPKGTERIRICLHSFNTSAEIKKLTQAINDHFAE